MESIGYQCGIREHCFIDRTKKGRHVHYNIANPSSLRFRIAKKITYNPVCITSWQNVDELIVFYVCNADLILLSMSIAPEFIHGQDLRKVLGMREMKAVKATYDRCSRCVEVSRYICEAALLKTRHHNLHLQIF